MGVRELLEELKELLEEERQLLLSFPVKDVKRFEEIQERKRELLLKISSFEREEVEKERELLLEIFRLNSTISALVVNGLSFFEEIERELFGDSITYTDKTSQNLFDRRA